MEIFRGDSSVGLGFTADAVPTERRPMDSLDKLLAEYPDFLTPEEVSEILRTTPARVRQQLSGGTIPGYQPGGSRWVIAKPDLVTWMRAGSNQTERKEQANAKPNAKKPKQPPASQ